MTRARILKFAGGAVFAVIAIDLIATDRLPLDRLITAVEPLERLPALFEEHADGSAAMKVLVDCHA